MRKLIWLLLFVFLSVGTVYAKVDVVTLPKRDSVQLTIYNSADLTLVREQRALTLKSGINKLQFSWANTLIDPTSLEMLPKDNAKDIDNIDLKFPPRVRELGLWYVNSAVGGNVPVEISYLTSGLSWRAFYSGTLTKDETAMQLKGYVRVTNDSGEDYENAQTRLIVGKVNLIDEIAGLARKEYPYGRPQEMYPTEIDDIGAVRSLKREMMKMAEAPAMSGASRPKEIKKEGLSEYFLYTIEGTETIPTGWSKRLPSFKAEKVPVVNFFKYEEERYGPQAYRFLSFKNDKKHNLGSTPIPGGIIKVFRSIDKENHFSYEGQSNFKYIPVDEDVELNLGPVSTVIVEPKLMDYKTNRYMFDNDGDIIGWDEIREFKIEVKNTRDVPVKVEITRNVNIRSWDLNKSGDYGKYEKIDLDTFRFTLELKERSQKEFAYQLTTHHGKRGGE